MSELEQLELIIRRIHAKRAKEHAEGKTTLNLDTQELLREIAEEIAFNKPIIK